MNGIEPRIIKQRLNEITFDGESSKRKNSMPVEEDTPEALDLDGEDN